MQTMLMLYMFREQRLTKIHDKLQNTINSVHDLYTQNKVKMDTDKTYLIRQLFVIIFWYYNIVVVVSFQIPIHPICLLYPNLSLSLRPKFLSVCGICRHRLQQQL